MPPSTRQTTDSVTGAHPVEASRKRAAFVRRVLFGVVVLLSGSLSAMSDRVLHPEIPFFDREHLVVGGATALLLFVVFGALDFYLAQRQLAEATLQQREAELHEAQRVARVGSWEWVVGSDTITWSSELRHLLRYDRTRRGPTFATLDSFYAPESWARLEAAVERARSAGEPYALELEMLRTDGTSLWTTTRGEVVRDPAGQIVKLRGAVLDITERKQAEAERAALGAQLRHAEKLESVGRLAGGVAHEFNNMLAVILGFTELSMQRMGPADRSYADLLEVQKAAQRSAALTRQLLAYARKQIMQPTLLDVNSEVSNLLGMLQRLIGENIHLVWEPGTNLWPVMKDPAHLTSGLVNLCLNARDAIADVGTITLATANCTLAADFCATHPDAVPGDYVRLTVRDTGRGMDAATLGRIFEPFYTTKGVGEGTGLGLASVYGAAKQSGGFITAASVVGHGTTFELYQPRRDVEALRAREPEVAAPNARGHETILLVEDEPGVLRLTTQALALRGYTVLAASSAAEALRLVREHPDDIHLLLTDVVMPEMNGRTLADAVLALRPSIRQLFMSGHTADVIASRGMLEPDVAFIEKPCTLAALTAKVREVLDGA